MVERESHNKNTKDSLDGQSKIHIEHPECNRTVQEGKVVLSKKAKKTYTVTVTYIQITEEEAKTKRAIIESIIKKSLKI